MSEPVTAQQAGLSIISTRKSSFLWKISNFRSLRGSFQSLLVNQLDNNSYCLENFDGILQSPTFYSDFDDFKWSLVMFSSKSNYHTYPFLGFKLQSKDLDVEYYAINVKLVISILKNNGDKYSKSQNCFIYRKRNDNPIHYYSKNTFYSEYLVEFLNTNDLFDESEGYLRNDDLHVLCEYELTSSSRRHYPILKFKNQDLINLNIADSLGKQWKDQEFCDYELVAPCGRRLSTHKLVLSARSPVFQAMLKSDTEEKKNDSVQIEDISYEVLEEMLQFMYFGKISKQDLVDGVLSAAVKYQIPDLKDACKKLLFNNLNVENAAKTLELCELYDLTDLRPHAELFVNSNLK